MARQRPNLGTPFGTDGPWLAAILDALGDIHDLLDVRLRLAEPIAEPAPARRPAGVPVREPAPDAPPPTAVPVAEPAPDDLDEPEQEEEQCPLPPPPPRAGRGSGLDAWQAFANLAGVDYPDDASRADIITACEAAEVIAAER